MTDQQWQICMKAKKLLKQCGYWTTHRFLRNRNIPLRTALLVLGYPNRFDL